MRTVNAWQFVGHTLRDGGAIPADGVKLKFDDKPMVCEQLFQASIDAFDALQCARGETLCYVRCGGKIVYGSDKLVCTEITIIRRMYARELLRYFARMQALSLIHMYPNDTDQVVFDYLMTGDESLRAAARSTALFSPKIYNDPYAYALSAVCAATLYSEVSAAINVALHVAPRESKKEFNDLVKECFF